MSVKESAKIFAKFAKKDNRIAEKFSKKYPHYLEWMDEEFEENKELIATVIGRF